MGPGADSRGFHSRNAKAEGRSVHSQSTFEAALAAYDAYWTKGGEHKLAALLGRARLLASWPGKGKEAQSAYRAAIKDAVNHGSKAEQIEVLHDALRWAQRAGVDRLELFALKRLSSIESANPRIWEMLIRHHEEAKRSRAVVATYTRMLGAEPDNPAIQILYARHLADTSGVAAATEYLEAQIETGLDEALLLTGIVNIQFNGNRPEDAKRTVEVLASKYPDHPATPLLYARQQLRSADYDAAIQTLMKSIERADSESAKRLLARAYFEKQDYPAAAEAIKNAIQLAEGNALDSRRVKARIVFESGDHRKRFEHSSICAPSAASRCDRSGCLPSLITRSDCFHWVVGIWIR